MQPDDRARLQHMLEAATEALELVAGKDVEDLFEDRRLGYSLLWLLATIGEAANQVTAETQAVLHLPWSDMVGMRNRLIHGYFDLNMAIVHKTVQESLPQIIDLLHDHLDAA